MKLLQARRNGASFTYKVQLIDTDDQSLFEQTFTAAPRAVGETIPQFTARLTAFEAVARREMRLLCLARLDVIVPPENVPLPGEGTDF